MKRKKTRRFFISFPSVSMPFALGLFAFGHVSPEKQNVRELSGKRLTIVNGIVTKRIFTIALLFVFLTIETTYNENLKDSKKLKNE